MQKHHLTKKKSKMHHLAGSRETKGREIERGGERERKPTMEESVGHEGGGGGRSFLH